MRVSRITVGDAVGRVAGEVTAGEAFGAAFDMVASWTTRKGNDRVGSSGDGG